MAETIEFQDFLKVDIRVGKVLAVDQPEWSHKLLELTVDFGDELGKKTIFAGVKQYYDSKYFLDKKFLFVVNLAPKKMGEAISQGMMLMIDSQEKPIAIPVDDQAEMGRQVS